MLTVPIIIMASNTKSLTENFENYTTKGVSAGQNIAKKEKIENHQLFT